MKKVISLLLAVMLVFALCAIGVSAADVTIQPTATVGGQTVTMTATGVQDSFTKFDIMVIFGSSGGPYTYALWFDSTGTFSFDKDVTLKKSVFDENFNQVDYTFDAKAGTVYSIAAGVNGESWSEYGVTLDDGNTWMIIDSSNPGNYANSPADTALASFPGTVLEVAAAAPAEPEPAPAEPEPAPAEPAPAPAETEPAPAETAPAPAETAPAPAETEPAPAETAPAPAETTPAPAPAPKPATTPITGKTYTVVAGDCLWSIAQRVYGTGTKWGELWAANASTIANPRLIFPGQVIQIP